MKKVFIYFALLSFVFLGFVLGTSNINDDPLGARKKLSDAELKQRGKNSTNQTDRIQANINQPHSTSAFALFVDSLNGANDTVSLQARGYVIHRRGGPPGFSPIWFQGGEFPAFNGPSTGYVASNFQSTTGINAIDNWLILPALNIQAGDFFAFYSRSIFENPFPDSIKVMYSASGATDPSDPSWVELAYFLANDQDVWERRQFFAPTPGPNARFAIRYFVIDGGPLGSNSNYIGIDMITVERPGPNDVGPLSINSPARIIVLPTAPIVPSITLQNYGSATQFNIPVTFQITGPVNYISNRVIPSLAPGASTVVTFDNFSPVGGNYVSMAYTSLPVDADRGNDTIRSTFTANFPDYGSGGTYFYSNSIASGAPSVPQYCWKDTSGSKSLVVNNGNVAGSILTGNLDDGYFALGKFLPANRKIRFMGVDYDSIFIGTNGIISFKRFTPGSGNWNPPANGLPGSDVRPAFYPLWIDLDFGDSSVASNRLSYKVNDNFQLIITYDNAPQFFADPSEYVSMQIVMDIVENSYTANSRIMVQYSPTGTGSGFHTQYNANTLPTHLVGLQDATGTNTLMYRFRNSSTVTIPGPLFGPSPIAVQFGPDPNKLNHRCGNGILTLTALFEGCYGTGNPFFGPVTVYLRNTSGNYEVTDAATSTLNATGTGAFIFEKVEGGTGYYIVIKTANSIETWSAVPVSFSGGLMTYDFTTAVSQAFGNNMKLVNGASGVKAAMYVGDVTGDEFVDAGDLSAIDNDAQSGVPGSVSGLATDLTCDDFVDAGDLSIADNNSFNAIGTIRPF